jgi:hypothetical protein
VDQTQDVIFGDQLFRAQIVEKSLFLSLLAYHDASLRIELEGILTYKLKQP